MSFRQLDANAPLPTAIEQEAKEESFQALLKDYPVSYHI